MSSNHPIDNPSHQIDSSDRTSLEGTSCTFFFQFCKCRILSWFTSCRSSQFKYSRRGGKWVQTRCRWIESSASYWYTFIFSVLCPATRMNNSLDVSIVFVANIPPISMYYAFRGIFFALSQLIVINWTYKKAFLVLSTTKVKIFASFMLTYYNYFGLVFHSASGENFLWASQGPQENRRVTTSSWYLSRKHLLSKPGELSNNIGVLFTCVCLGNHPNTVFK